MRFSDEAVLRLVVAVVLGAIVGAEREANDQPAGLRTHIAVCLGAAGYVAMIAGLGLGANADTNITPLGARADIERRRALLERGQLGNRLAIGAGVAAAVAMATGIALIVIGRRRADLAPRSRTK